MGITIEGNTTAVVPGAQRGEPAGRRCNLTNGRWDFVAEIRADTLEAFDCAFAASAASTALLGHRNQHPAVDPTRCSF